MRALTIRQPWAWAITCGLKRVENRTWSTNYRGPLLIHAGKTVDVGAFSNYLIRDAAARVALHAGLSPTMTVERNRRLLTAKAHITGAFVALGQLVDVHKDTGRCCQEGWAERSIPYALEVYHWVLQDVDPTPVVGAAGKQGLWTPNVMELAALGLKP